MIVNIKSLFERSCFLLSALCFMLLIGLNVQAQQSNSPREKILFDFNWRFHKGGAQGADQPGFNDSKWRKIDLPHDWSIEDLPGTRSPFDSNAIGQVMTGFTVGGLGWYRKTFVVPATEKGKRIILQFDGVYMNADVWLNGGHLGNHPYGYTSFWYDITNEIKFGEKNVLSVQVKNDGQNSRWYSGSGIDRHVWLTYLDPVHVAHWGIAITTPEADEHAGNVNIKTTVKNQTGTAANIILVTRILDDHGNEVAKVTSDQTVSADSAYLFDQHAIVKDPRLWSVDFPNRYTALTEVYADKKLSDKLKTKFGIRTISFDAVHGFRLNGKTLKLKGGCFHIDNGPLGTKSYDRAEIRRVALLKASGFNAIRCSHNPPAPAFLNACDSLGMLVIDEAFDMWEDPKTPFDYHLYFDHWWRRDMKSMLFRDRNHPSIIMWSIGNEIPYMGGPRVDSVAKVLADYVRSMEPTRPVTAAVNSVSPVMDNFFSALDVCGYNYAVDHYVPDHERKPNRVMFATESFPLDAFDYWMAVRDHPWVIGDFVWTAWDYIGEASIGWRGYPQEHNFYPWNLAYCGDIDICGWKRPQSYYRDALWMRDQLSIFVKPPKPSFPLNPEKASWSIWNWDDVVADWNWKGYENRPFEVDVYSSCDRVELFLNGKSLGEKNTDRSTKYRAVFQVPYQSGTLKAVGYDGSKVVATSFLKTSGNPTHIKLTADRSQIKADGEDLSYITVELTDDKGVKDPKAENMVHFKIKGAGTIVGVGNANPMSTESDQLPQREVWKGRCLVIVKSDRKPGDIILTASSRGLPVQSIMITSH